ncbi:MAG TPA: PD-(D/E)XK nuclease family protein [Oligoflexia bacterium]|nr:PD-(D/E)XK nuclease family protein [Oligoflexia bacterium]HMP26449.1 PD-(D/E)XK nuclease family protein [Oligoflexia bacterium]
MPDQAVKKIFTSPEKNIYEAAAEVMLEDQANGVDLSKLLLILPTSRSIRRLKEYLLENHLQKNNKRCALSPRFITIGQLIDVCLPDYNWLSEHEQIKIWEDILTSSRQQLAQTFEIGEEYLSEEFWRSFAESLNNLQAETAAAGFYFRDIANAIKGNWREERWSALAKLEESYLAKLSDLTEQNRYVKMLELVRTGGKIKLLFSKIYLVGLVDLSDCHKEILNKTEAQKTILISAPAEWSEAFDQSGALNYHSPQIEEILKVEIKEDLILKFEDVSSQNRFLAEYLNHSLNKQSPPLLIDLNPENHRELFLRLALNEMPARAAGGSRAFIGHYGAFVKGLLGLSEKFEDFSKFISHPWMLYYLEKKLNQPQETILRNLNKFRKQRVADRVNFDDEDSQLAGIINLIKEIIFYIKDNNSQKSIAEWSLRLLGIINNYAPASESEVLPQHPLTKYLLNLSTQQLQIKSVEYCQIINRELYLMQESESEQDGAVEIAGLLETQLNDTPAVFLLNFCEEYVPATKRADPFLSDTLRAKLGLSCNRRLYLRDRYLVTSLVLSKRVQKILIPARGIEGEPLSPAIFIYDQTDQNLPLKVAAYGKLPTIQREKATKKSIKCNKSLLSLPKTIKIWDKNSLPITALTDYLQCPYRFYLKHLLNIKPYETFTDELDPAQVGEILHAILKGFGESNIAHEQRAEIINHFLVESCNKLFEERYSKISKSALRIQKLQFYEIFKMFAQWQAIRIADGWQIAAVEHEIELNIKLPNNREILLSGRIDRIDLNQATKEISIIDYKSSQTAASARATHKKRDGWVNLQLPLYEIAAQKLYPNMATSSGNLRLKNEQIETALSLCKWSVEELESALEEAKRVAQLIYANVFWPPNQSLSHFSQYSWINSSNIDGYSN